MAGAQESYLKAIEIRESLVATQPQDVQSRRDLARSYVRIGSALIESEAARGTDYLRRGVEAYGRLAADEPADAETIVSRAGLAETQAKLGERSAAVAECSRAIALLGELADDPAHSAQRGLRGLAYLRIARAHAALAASKKAVAAEPQAHRRTARDMYARSLAIWQDMQQRGILTGDYATKPQEVAQELAKYESLL